jgi:hypothetical protein
MRKKKVSYESKLKIKIENIHKGKMNNTSYPYNMHENVWICKKMKS